MKTTLRVISVLLFIVGIIWMIVSPGFDALTAFITGLLTLLTSFIVDNKPDTESLDQRNRRILLNHVENFWVKGVLEKSLHGAAMLDLGIKEDPEAVTYPWAIKKEATGETLPAGTSMLEIFDQIGMGRSLLILGAPGSGKTTMLLELARQLIERARQNADEPIPMVFNLASWTEKLTLADWLARELNNIYYVPRKTAPDWVKGNKLLLLLDGLDEVRQESRAKCVEAINQFRKEHGLTSLAVCSRSQDYEELGAKLAFDGAIEAQPLTQKQVTTFFNRFGKEMAGLKQVLKKDSALRELAETPLFLSIMIMAYRDKQDVDIMVSQDVETKRKHLFDNYIQRMFEHPRSINTPFKKPATLHWLSWLAGKMTLNNQITYQLEDMQQEWANSKNLIVLHRIIISFICGLIGGYTGQVLGILMNIQNLIPTLLFGVLSLGLGWFYTGESDPGKRGSLTADLISWDSQKVKRTLPFVLPIGIIVWLIIEVMIWWLLEKYPFPITSRGALITTSSVNRLISVLSIGLMGITWFATYFIMFVGLTVGQLDQSIYSGQKIALSWKNFILMWLVVGSVTGLSIGSIFVATNIGLGIESTMNTLNFGMRLFLFFFFGVGFIGFYRYGGFAILQHYILRYILSLQNILPWKLIPFLDYCTDLIFLRRVGGGYIFVHRLLMEHFAAMYKE